jgi:hypothetical protein
MRLREFNQLEQLLESFQSVTWTLYEEPQGDTVVRTASTFNLNGFDALVTAKFKDFVEWKNLKLDAYGSKDYPMNSRAPLGSMVPGLMHAGLTQDVSVFYKIHGRKPRYLDIYGLFRHKDIGIGNTPNIKKQQKYAKVFSREFA